MPAWVTTIDQLGPEKVLHVYDPSTELRGVVVVDTVSIGGAAGGTRMLPDITTEEIFLLARAMTHKFAILDFPIGGAKAGIWAEPGIRGPQRRELMLSFGKAVKTLLGTGVTLAADMGTDNDDVAT
ncbi:MAG: Glu/Leu/Phe/Val dehydrogenase dimerization domain-containing protein, partial [Dehalococcoidia bacterium]|nr:Glu/Leu/Phe/Val dehydrogenase dimerization domain-containing protein [Dehalococcoidia bacterium]